MQSTIVGCTIFSKEEVGRGTKSVTKQSKYCFN